MARKSGRQQQRSGKKQRTQRQQQRSGKKQRTQRQQQRSQKRRSQKKRPLNAFMKQLNVARSSKAESFEYNGKSYKRRELETGMVVYKGV
jgi:hypothetical protein